MLIYLGTTRLRESRTMSSIAKSAKSGQLAAVLSFAWLAS
jgi:hypothetical protein